jgi:leucyl-tRNA synthetase
MVLKDGTKMSKSKGNVVSPEDIIARYGADTARMFILFAAPPERDLEWSDQAVEGCFRFLNRVWRLVGPLMKELKEAPDKPASDLRGANREMRRITHKTIKKVTEDISTRFNFNTAVSAIMEHVNALYQFKEIPESDRDPDVLSEAVDSLLLLLAPFAPHITEEIWEATGHEGSIHRQSWPAYDAAAVVEDELTIVVQINSRVRDRIMIPAGLTVGEMQEKIMNDPKILKLTEGKKIVKIIPVPGKLVNIVVK